MVSEVPVIDGKFVNHDCVFEVDWKLNEIDFVKAMDENSKYFITKFGKSDNIAISVWTTPKRTKNGPYARVYKTLRHDGIKITIIPVFHTGGINSGDQNLIQPGTVDLMTCLGVYAIIGVYVTGEGGKRRSQSKNAKNNLDNKKGKPIITKQKFDLTKICEQISEIIEKKPGIKDWNKQQIILIPTLLEKSMESYGKMSKKLEIPLKSFKRIETRVKKSKEEDEGILEYYKKESMRAQHSESSQDQKLEKVPGEKAKINISYGETTKLYWTGDSVFINEEEEIVEILEAKNTSSAKFPSEAEALDAILKLQFFKKCDFQYNGKKFEKKLICYLSSSKKSSIEEFKIERKNIIDECNANDIELKFNNEIIK